MFTRRWQLNLNGNSSGAPCQRLRWQRGIGESTQSLEMPVADRPDMGEGYINGHAYFSCLSLDTTEGDDFLARGNELVGDEANVESRIEAGKKALEHILEAFEMAAADGIPSGKS